MFLRTASSIIVTRALPVVNDVFTGDPKELSFAPHDRPQYFRQVDIDDLGFWQERLVDNYYTDHTRPMDT